MKIYDAHKNARIGIAMCVDGGEEIAAESNQARRLSPVASFDRHGPRPPLIIRYDGFIRIVDSGIGIIDPNESNQPAIFHFTDARLVGHEVAALIEHSRVVPGSGRFAFAECN